MWVQEPDTKSQGPSFLQEMFGQVWRSLWPRPLALGHRLLGLQRTLIDTSCSRSLGDTRLPQKGGWGGSSTNNRSHEEGRWELGRWEGPEPLRKAEGGRLVTQVREAGPRLSLYVPPPPAPELSLDSFPCSSSFPTL